MSSFLSTKQFLSQRDPSRCCSYPVTTWGNGLRMKPLCGNDTAQGITKQQTHSSDALVLDFLIHEGILLTIETRPSWSFCSLCPKISCWIHYLLTPLTYQPWYSWSIPMRQLHIFICGTFPAPIRSNLECLEFRMGRRKRETMIYPAVHKEHMLLVFLQMANYRSKRHHTVSP